MKHLEPKVYLIIILLSAILISCQQNAAQKSEDIAAKREKLLEYFEALPEKKNNKIIAGQQVGHGNQTAEYYNELITELHQQTDEWVGLLGVDYGYFVEDIDYKKVNKTIIDHWNKGGLVTISWHAQNPWTNGNTWDTDQVDIKELLDDNSKVNQVWKKQLNTIADALSDLQENGVVVIWRPFHEMNGGWFWWGLEATAKNPDLFKQLWIYQYDFFKKKGLKNLLWCYSVNKPYEEPFDVLAFYPGDELVDIVGQDVYSDVIEDVY